MRNMGKVLQSRTCKTVSSFERQGPERVLEATGCRPKELLWASVDEFKDRVTEPTRLDVFFSLIHHLSLNLQTHNCFLTAFS